MQLRNYANYWVSLFGDSDITASHKILTQISPRVMSTDTGVEECYTLWMWWGQSDLPNPWSFEQKFYWWITKSHRPGKGENELCGFFNLRSQTWVQSRLVIDNLWQMFGGLCVEGSQFRFCFTFPEQVCSHPSTKMFALWESRRQIFHRKAINLIGIKFGYLFISLRVVFS